ncbi:MAG: UbiH/UbiF/VisC/COQ6 family ubiquinone biosynthesis hydroxylase [Alphaproteobacteria bacterium]|nr:UbiH/UbiF/VisC/COQ6 family ubiquinone biosynthesis hydroxylase [Alphaproteobacteria bacterium]
MKPAPHTQTVEALVVGAGMAGMSLAHALASAGVEVAVVDRADPAAMTAPGHDGRTTAIAAGSRRVLEGIGLWGALAADACPIDDIRVSDGDSLMFLHFDSRELGDEPLGHILENRPIRESFFAAAGRAPALELLAPAEIADLARTDTGVVAELAGGETARARVVFACDGRGSRLRRDAGIRVTEWRYDQSSFVCAIAHEQPHRNIAHERFLPGGPFALLPMHDLDNPVDGLRHCSSVVWSESNRLVPALRNMDDTGFSAALANCTGGFLGRIALAGPRSVYPLGLSHAARYVDRRMALVGDAAHAIHPIAGQGLNMGIRDVAALAELVVDARRLGRDIGEPDILADYERWRRSDNMTLAVTTDLLTRLFSNDIAPVRAARDAGLAAVNAAPPLRRFFMRHAMGVVGDLPRLVRGEAL